MRIHPLKHPQITEASSCTLLCRQLMIVQPLSQPRKPLLNIDSAICSLQLPPATFPPNPNTNQFCSKPVPQLRRPRKKERRKKRKSKRKESIHHAESTAILKTDRAAALAKGDRHQPCILRQCPEDTAHERESVLTRSRCIPRP